MQMRQLRVSDVDEIVGGRLFIHVEGNGTQGVCMIDASMMPKSTNENWVGYGEHAEVVIGFDELACSSYSTAKTEL
jgi:hypothetical protein